MIENWMVFLECPKCGKQIQLLPVSKETVKLLLKKIVKEVEREKA